jgi:hypothetical protein
MIENRTGLLKHFAAKYVWWKTTEGSCDFPKRIIAQVMELGDYDDVLLLLEYFSTEELIDVLKTAEAGIFSHRSWNYWHYKLNLSRLGSVPPLPKRMVG